MPPTMRRMSNIPIPLPIPPPNPPIPPNSMLPIRPPIAKPAMAPPNRCMKLGRCIPAAGDAGWLNERDGDVGVVGLAGDEGREGDEYDREPRLPPPPARAHASPTWPTTTEAIPRAAIPMRTRCFIRTDPL